MPLLFRRLDRKNGVWALSQRPTWLGPDDVPADVLSDLKTEDNGLSLWVIDEARTNLDAVIAAVAANRQNFDRFDFALFDQARVTAAGFQLHQTQGVSKDPNANVARHVDIEQLTGYRVARLARVIYDPATIFERRFPDEVKALVAGAVQAGRVPLNGLSDSSRKKVELLLKSATT